MAEKVESPEQVPLKSDTDNTETVPVEGGDVEAGKAEEVPEKKKKGFAFWKKNKNVDSEAAAAETKEVSDEKPKKCWWSRKNNEKIQKEDEPIFGFDMIHRDEKNLHTAIDLGFSDIFGEPDAVRSFDGVWKLTNNVFNAVRNFVYKFLTFVIAIPLAIIYGVVVGVISVIDVFVFVPVTTLLAVPAGWLFKAWQFIIANVFDPVFKSVGQAFSGISVRKYGINSEVTQPITA